MASPALTSYRTTIGAIVVFLSLFFGEVKNAFDSDPATTVNYNHIVEAAGVLWLGLAARDSKVTSEDAGAKTKGR